MRTIFISRTVPWPLNNGGNVRVYHLLKALRGVSDVTFVCPSPGGKGAAEAKTLLQLCKEVILFPLESFVWHQDTLVPRPLFWVKTALRVLHPTRPIVLQVTKSAEGRKLLAKLLSEHFDLVWAERLTSLSLLPYLKNTRLIVDLDDLEHRKLALELRHEKKRGTTLFRFLEFLKLRRIERNLQDGPGEFTVCSETDRAVLGGGPRVWVVPNGVELPARRTDSPCGPDGRGSNPVFVFVGAMDYSPNIDAAVWFVQNVFPLIRLGAPASKFMIVGRNPTNTIQALHNADNVLVTGTVPDVSPYLSQAVAAVVPLRFGGGTRLKILEAMAHSKPVVSTSVGAEGLNVRTGKHLLIADTPEAMAEACLRLLWDHSTREQLEREGFELVRSQYQWEAIERHVQTIVAPQHGPVGQHQILAELRTRGGDRPDD